MRLSPRLLKIAGLIPENSVVADVGTDHALLPVYLVITGRSPRVIATEAKPGPLAAARRTVEEFSAFAHVDLRLGYGLTPIAPREVDVLVIAGIGERTLIEILERSPDVRGACRRLVLQPMGGAAKLRRWLVENGMAMVDEELVRDQGQIHELIVAEPGRGPGSRPGGGPGSGLGGGGVLRGALPAIIQDVCLEVGPILWAKRHPLLKDFIGEKLERYRSILGKISASRLREDRVQADFARRVGALERMLEELCREEPGDR